MQILSVAPRFLHFFSLSILFCGFSAFADEKDLVELESNDGRKLTAELVEKSNDKVKIKVGHQIYVLPFDKLSEDSANLVKKANIPPMCDFKLDGDITKRTKTHRSSKTVPAGKGETRQEYSSHKTDTVEGKVVVENSDVREKSPAAQLKIVVLAKDENKIFVLNQVSHAVPEIEPLKSLEFSIDKAHASHSYRGQKTINNYASVKGSYYGYIAAVFVDNRIVAIKSVPVTYERDLEEAKKVLGSAPVKPWGQR